MTAASQRSMARGAIAPSMYGRVDLAQYATGLRTCRNSFIMRQGGGKNRSGTKFSNQYKDSKITKLIGFDSGTNSFVLIFGDLYMRVVKDNSLVTLPSEVISGATQASQCVLTITGHTLSVNDEIHVEGVVGMVQLNNRNFKITNTTATTVDIAYVNGTAVDSTGYDAYISDGTSAEIFEIVTIYPEADLTLLKDVQSVDVMTLTHQNHPVQELRRVTDTNWTIADKSFTPETGFPENGTAVAGGAGGPQEQVYKVTAINADNFEESLPGLEPIKTITGASQANPVVLTVAAHLYVAGDTVAPRDIVGMIELNDRRFTVGTVLSVNTFELKDEDGTGYAAYSSGGTCGREEIKVANASLQTVANPNIVTWDAVDGVKEYVVYRSLNGIFGFLGTAAGLTFDDGGVIPDTSDTPPSYRNPFFNTGNYPATAAYHQQRLLLANTINKPEFVEGSRTGRFDNFTTSFPLKDDDAVSWQLSGKKINAVQNLLDINGKLMTLTESGEWRIAGDGGGVITPVEINPVQESYNGSSFIKPVVVNSSALYIQARQSTIRDLGFSFDVDGYTGDDLTVNAAHFFDNFTVKAWAHQQIPHSIVWQVRDDGDMIGLTYIPEQGMLAFHQHDFEGGLIKDLVVIPEGTEDAVYMTIEREVDILGNGTPETVHYLERMVTQKLISAEDQIFMDSSFTVDGRNKSATTMTLTAIEATPTWDYDENLTLTSNSSVFESTDPATGRQIGLNGFKTVINEFGEDEIVSTVIRCTIKSFTSPTVVVVRPQKEVDPLMRAVAITDWSSMTDTIDELWHLEGQEVSVFADGFVVASVHNPEYPAIIVENGRIKLDRPYGLKHVGLPVTSDIETLSIDTANGKTLQPDKKLINNVTLLVEATRGLWLGNHAPSNDDVDPLQGLNEFKTETIDDYEQPVVPVTGTIEVNMEADWNDEGLVFIRQVDPVQMVILNITPRGAIPFA